MRNRADIQKAHDILVAVKLKEVPVYLDDADADKLTAALDVLCWVLGHDHNHSFRDNLKAIEEEAAQNGAVLVALPGPLPN